MDDLDIFRNSDDPVVRRISTYNEGYILEEVLLWYEAYSEGIMKFWTSWRPLAIMSITMIYIFIFIFSSNCNDNVRNFLYI